MRRKSRIVKSFTLEPELFAFVSALSKTGAPSLEIQPGSRSDVMNDALRMLAEAAGVEVKPGMTEGDFQELLGS